MERRDGLALAAAIALHVALLVARPKIVAVATPTPPVTGVIELYEQPPSPAPTPVEPGARVAEPREPAAPVAAEPGSAAGSRVTPSPGAEPRAAAGDTAPHGDTPPGDPPPGDPPPAGTAQTPDLSRPPPPGGGPSLPPGLGGTPVWALPGVLRPMGGPLPAPTAALGAGFTPPPGYAWDEQRRKFCIPIGIRGRGDLSNLAAHRQTVVRSSFSVKRDGERALPSEDILPIDTRVPWAKEDPTLRKPPPKKKKKRRGARK